MESSKQTRIIRDAALPFVEVKIGADTCYAVRPHSHRHLSIGIVRQGASHILCQPFEFGLCQNQAILIPPDTIHLCRPHDPARFTFEMLFICPDWLKASLGIDAGGLSTQVADLAQTTLDQVSHFTGSFQNQLPPSAGDHFLDESQAISFLDDLLTRSFNLTPQTSPAHTCQLDPRGVEKVKTYLDKAFTDDIQLSDLAQLTGASKYAIIRQFKRRWQITPHAYVLNLRINRAKTLLKSGHTIADTAAACGFFDQSHFIKTFKNYVGVLPTHYPK